MAGIGTGAGPPVVNVYHEKSRILPDVSRVLACLYEKDVKFETIRASYKDLLSLQASRSVPVPFYDGPVFLQDSRAICRYVAETYEHQGYPFLLGKDALERASIEQWLRHEEHAFDPPSRALFCHLAFPPESDEDDDNLDIDREMRKLDEVLGVYEQRLDETKFLAGNKFTLADLVHLPGVHHVIGSDKYFYLYDSRKNVRRWWEQISARESWQQVLRDMKTVEEQHKLEKQQELEEKQKQPSPTFGGRDIHIDPRQQEGTKPQTVLVAPPSIGTVSTSISPAPQDRETTSEQKPSSPNQRRQGGFFTTTEKPPPPSRQTEPTSQKSPSSDNGTKSTFFTPASTHTTSKENQRTDAAKFSYKDVRSPTEKAPSPLRPTDPTIQKTPSSVSGAKSTFFTPSSTPTSKTDSPRNTNQRSSREAPDKSHHSDFFKASNHKDATGSLIMPSPKDSSKIPRAGQINDEVFTDKAPNKIDETDFHETESKLTGVSPQVDKPVPSTYTTPDRQTPQTLHVKPPEQRGGTSVGPEPGPKMKSDVHTDYTPSKGDTADVINDPDRFSTKRLREVFNPDTEDSPYSSKQEEAPIDPQKRSALHDREKQTTMIPDSIKSGGSPSPNMRALYAPVTDEERSAILPAKGGMATTGEEKSLPNQQVPHAAPGTDQLAEAGVNTGTPKGAPSKIPTGDRNGSAPVHGADPTIITSDEQSEKSSTMGEKALGATPRKTSPAERRGSSAPVKVQEVTLGARVKQRQAGQEILEVQDIGDSDTAKKRVADKKAAEPNSQQTTESIKGVGRTLQSITTDESTKAAQASGGQYTSIVPHGGTLDTNGKDAVTSSPNDPRSLAPIPATQRPEASGKMPTPELPLSDAWDKKTGIAETSQTSMGAPNEKPGRRVSWDAGESSSEPSPIKSQEYVNEAHKKQDDQSGAKLVENRVRQGDDVAPYAKTNNRKEEDYIANANNNNNRKAQAATNDAPSKQQIQSGKNKPEMSKDVGMGINETENSRSLETSKEVQPSYPEKSMEQQRLQETRSATSLQENVKKSTDTPLLRSGIQKQKEDDLSTEEGKNNGKAPGEVRYEERTSPDTQQDK
ncbi:hypothetical protein PR202_ga31518 [Eleusine coracana subsp. coracana]|uniref:glutathione transferase n=1 Tax=Eleusine coracana subsp. coracana TaxID=191504 RepID=A0AAV5DSA1_ELECO|nr:hypothetical protein QOZ80_8AG0625420 [Eleusine coracana subsp. coracana]GJN13174.1 hypothetical protein PR202_ga31518 [Eleusine coracana subsp. coracana]